MRKGIVVAAFVLALVGSADLAYAQGGEVVTRANVRNGDVWTMTLIEFGGFVDFFIGWTKKADMDILVAGGANLDTVCVAQSTQDGFERCYFGSGHTNYTMLITTFSGAKNAKGIVGLSVTDPNFSISRTGERYQFAYLGNIHDDTDDPVLLELRERAAHQKAAKQQRMQQR